MKISSLLVTIAVAVSCVGCGLHSTDEVSRVTSPNGKADAVIFEGSAGATTSYEYQIFLVNQGAKVAESNRVARLHGASRNDQAYGVNLRWQQNDLLQVEYLKAQSAHVSQPQITVNGASFAVVLKDGVLDPTAPSGSMLFNRK